MNARSTCLLAIPLALLLLACVPAVSLAEAVRLAQAPDVTDLELRAHPRLWVPRDTIYNLKDKLHTPYLKSSAKRIIADADWLVTADPVMPGEGRTHQRGTRAIASHLQTLTSAYVLTREQKYRDAAIRHLANILNWNHISCEANPNTPIENRKFFCLSYGEHSADIALMYDVFRPDITAAEMQVFNDVLDKFYLWQALRAEERNPWWVNKEWSNWNGVCAGGMGMLALAFYDDRPEARKLIPFVEESLSHYFQSYINSGGGNHEGTGYWNYGMHYAMRYLLSYENATGKKHPAFDIPEIGKSLHFPVDFHRITFGDNDGWHPSGMYFMVAQRTNQPDAAMRAAAYIMHEVGPGPAPQDRDRVARTLTGDILYAADYIPTDEAMRQLRAERAENPRPLARVYDGLGWATIADDTAFANLRLAVRGGSSAIRGHGHIDLMSIRAQVNGVRFIDDQRGGNMAVNYTGRGHELYSRSAAAKSTLFVGGVGCNLNAEAPIERVEGPGVFGFRVDGTRVYMPRWRRGPYIGRTALLVDSRYWLVIDTAPGRGMESRYHTYADVEVGNDWARLTKQASTSKHSDDLGAKPTEQLTMTFASLDNSVLQQSRGTPTFPAEQTHILRWMTPNKDTGKLHVTAMNPGNERLKVALQESDAGFTVRVTQPDGSTREVKLTRDLQLR